MKFLWWREKPWQQRLLLVLTAVTLVLLAAHPELRLLVPVVDLLGLDLVFLLAATQLLDVLRPIVDFTWRALSPTAVQLYFTFIFFLGIAGPYVDGKLRVRARDRTIQGRAWVP